MEVFTQILICLGAVTMIFIIAVVLVAIIAFILIRTEGNRLFEEDSVIERAYAEWLDTDPVVTPRDAFEAGARYSDWL